MARTERESDSKRSGRLVGAAETSKERAEWRRLQWKNWSILGLLKRKEWPHCHRESSWQVCRRRPCQKEKEQSRQSRIPDHEGGRESRWARAAPWRERGGSEREHGEEDSTVKKGRFRGRKGRTSKKSLPRTSRRKHERVSGCKSFPGRSAESWFHS